MPPSRPQPAARAATSGSTAPSTAPTVPAALAHPALRRYELRRLRLPLGSGAMPLVVPDPGDWLRRGEWTDATLRGAEPPYWVQVWPASVAVARLLARHGRLADLRVLDLGCGLGVPGLAAARAGAVTTFADREADALAFAQWNGERLAPPERIVVRQLDWSRDLLAGEFDLLVLADVSYRHVHHLALRRHLDSCLSAGGVVVHADPDRREATPFVQVLQRDFHALVTHRDTSFLDKRVNVRLTVGARDPQRLASWRAALGLPADESAPPSATVRPAG